MIRIENVSFRYASCREYTLRHINLHIREGEFVVLLGASGCGKTTITRLVNGLVPEFFEGELEGAVTVDGRNAAELNIQDLAGTVGSVFQDPRSQFFATDTTAEIAFSCENAGLPREELCARIEKAAGDLRITGLLERSIFELSSGEKQAVAIASVYAFSPKILVLDEPSANLDSKATEHLRAILGTLKKRGYTILISEHRIHYLRELADRALYIENGGIARELGREEFGGMPNETANRLGLRSLNLSMLRPGIHRTPPKAAQLCLDGVSFDYGKGGGLLKGVSFSAGKGEIIGIVGHNGVGKSTLLELICGLRKTRAGMILMDGAPAGPRTRVKNTYFVMQDSDYQLFTESVEKELYLGNGTDGGLREKGGRLLARMGLSELTQRHPASLSGGQKQRLCIAVACMKNAGVVCFDEPTSGLDYGSMKSVTALLHEIAEEGKTILLTSHDYEFLLGACTHICHLKNGGVADFFAVSEQSAPKIYGILHQKEESVL